MRRSEFKNAVEKPITIKDSRFGIRKMFFNTKEEPSIGGIYSAPGRGQNGESQT